MFSTILKLVWPYLQRDLTRRAAEYAAAYLQARREQRLPPPESSVTSPPVEVEVLAEPEVEPDVVWTEPLEASDDALAAPTPFLASNTFWYTLSGIALGTAFSLIVTYIFRQEKE
jgi:hypothetical protein